MINKIIGLVIDFVWGMIVAAYLLSHTSWGFQLYTKIADVPDIKIEDVQAGMNNLFEKGKSMYEFGNKIYKATK